MFEHCLAYRHDNGEVEGFKGVGFTEEYAKKRALALISFKIGIIRVHNPKVNFNYAQIIDKGEESKLTTDELAQVKRDWEV